MSWIARADGEESELTEYWEPTPAVPPEECQEPEDPKLAPEQQARRAELSARVREENQLHRRFR